MARKITGWAAFAVLTALYVYMVVAAVGNLTQLPQMAAQLGLAVNTLGWFWLWLGVALPALGYAVALLVGRGRSGRSKLLILVTALALVAALQLEISIVVPPTSFFM
mgnify:CR=1 FL=1